MKGKIRTISYFNQGRFVRSENIYIISYSVDERSCHSYIRYASLKSKEEFSACLTRANSPMLGHGFIDSNKLLGIELENFEFLKKKYEV